MLDGDISGDFAPTASLLMLKQRSELLQQTRHFFQSRGFLEVETPLLSHDTVIDRYIEPLSVNFGGRPMWLQTSPEFGMKRMLAAGAEAIYQITRAFRGEERGTYHNPEFTILEWYRVGDDMRTGIDLLIAFASDLLGSHFAQVERLTYREAFLRFADVDPFSDKFNDDINDTLLNELLVTKVEPEIAKLGAVVLHDYPPSQAALAQVRTANPPVAERFELYINGVELANGYHELLDPAVLRKRNETSNRLREQDGNRALPNDSRLLKAMDHGLPPCAGVALGIDRLVMLATGAKSIDEVLTFPIERA